VYLTKFVLQVCASHTMAGDTHLKRNGGEDLLAEIVATMSNVQDFLTSENSRSVDQEELLGLRDSLMEMQAKMHDLERMRRGTKKTHRVVRQLPLNPNDEMILELKDNLEILTTKLRANSDKDINGKYKKKAYSNY
jgi:hypothetical protein